MQKLDITWNVLQKRFKEDLQKVAKSFHMMLTKLDKHFIVAFRYVGQLTFKQRIRYQMISIKQRLWTMAQQSKAKIMDNGSTK